QCAGRVGLAVACLGSVRRGRGRRAAGDPARVRSLERALHEERVVVTLHDDELVPAEVLAGDVPGVACPTDADALALAYGVEGEPDVLAEDLPLGRLDRAGRLRQVAVQELAERPLADEADAGRVLLGVVRQPGLERDAAHFALLQIAHREYHAGELLLRQAVQEIALVLAAVLAPEEARAVDPGVVTGRDLGRTRAQ